MSFVRPELVARLRPWREAALWGAALAFGLWLLWLGWRGGAPLLLALGLLIVAASSGLLVTATRRQRLQGRPPGEGVVQIEEARIGYFGPRGGGFLDLDGLERVEMVSDGHRQVWQLTGEDGDALRIPVGARGAEGIYDALAAFVPLDEEALHAALAARQAARFPIWVRSGEAARRRLP